MQRGAWTNAALSESAQELQRDVALPPEGLTLAQEFAWLVKASGLTRQMLSAYLGVSKNTIRRWLARARADAGEAELADTAAVHPDRVRSMRNLYALRMVSEGVLGESLGSLRDFVVSVDNVAIQAVTQGTIEARRTRHAAQRKWWGTMPDTDDDEEQEDDDG